MLKTQVRSIGSSVLFVFGCLNAFYWLYNSPVFIMLAILTPAFGLCLAAWALYRGERGVWKHVGLWGNVLLFGFSLFMLVVITIVSPFVTFLP